MSAITEIINELQDSAHVIVDIPTRDGEHRRLTSVFKKREAPQFELVFPPNFLQFEDIELGTKCRLAVKHYDNAINLLAKVDVIDGDRTLLLTAMESISPESLRDYFRVTMNVPIQASHTPGPREVHAPWELTGNTVDMSGGGVLAFLPAKPINKSRIQLLIELPDHSEPVICVAHVVRTYRMRKQRYQVAFHFDEIDRKARDQIISSCLQEQRRQLRDNISVD
ncbi:MAG: hypothetical protein GQ559_08415 [Desulfobulbaceae bacterium]|nr:hypothetical protein [Desulfobulbaceae bacterium]